MNTMMIRLGVLATALTALCGGRAALAQDEVRLRPRFELAAGAFFSSSDADVRVNSNDLGLGTRISFVDDLGFEPDETVARADAILRLGERRRHQVGAGYFELSRGARKVINERIQFGDDVFDINADIRAELRLTFFKFDYTYMFYQRDKFEVGASIGVFGIDQNASLSEASLGVAETGDVTFPLPTLGGRGEFDLGRNFSLRGGLDVFFIDTGDYNGELYNALIGLEYEVVRHFAVGVGYNYADLDVGASREEGDINLGLQVDGALAYVRVSL